VVHPLKEDSEIWISKLTQQVNAVLKAAGENVHLMPRKTGAILTSMGFSHRTRTNSGWTLQLTRQDMERIHQLAACYGIDEYNGLIVNVSRENCGFCKNARLDQKEPGLTPDKLTYQLRSHDKGYKTN
jgi:hypothetical protein